MKPNKWFLKITEPVQPQQIDQGYENLSSKLKPSNWSSANGAESGFFTSEFYRIKDQYKNDVIKLFNLAVSIINDSSQTNTCKINRVNLFHAHMMANETDMLLLFHAFEYPTDLDLENEKYHEAVTVDKLMPAFTTSKPGFSYRNCLFQMKNTPDGNLISDVFHVNKECSEWNKRNVFLDEGDKGDVVKYAWNQQVNPNVWSVDQQVLMNEYNRSFPSENKQLYLHPCLNFFRERNQELVFFKR